MTEAALLPALKPRALRPGARIAVVSPASAANAERVRAGMERVRELGYEPVLSEHALASGPLYYAGPIAERLADLHAAFEDSSIDAIWCTRGGWGSAELLPGLNLDLIRANPKPFLGYSDHTSLHSWVGQQTGLVTFYAPMISPDLARPEGVELRSFRAALTSAEPWQLGAEAGLRLLRPARDPEMPTQLEGTLWGGCLALLTEALGTPYAPRPRPGSILFLEDVNTRPYQWDRMLLHLRYAGLLDGAQAIVFGNMRQCVTPEEDALLEGALLHALQEFAGPICIGLCSGHVDGPNVTLSLGVCVALDLARPSDPQLHFVEPAVIL